MENKKIDRINVFEVAENLMEDILLRRIQNLYFFINEDNELMKTNNKQLIPVMSDNIDCTYLVQKYYKGDFKRPSEFIKMLRDEINLMIDNYNHDIK